MFSNATFCAPPTFNTSASARIISSRVMSLSSRHDTSSASHPHALSLFPPMTDIAALECVCPSAGRERLFASQLSSAPPLRRRPSPPPAAGAGTAIGGDEALPKTDSLDENVMSHNVSCPSRASCALASRIILRALTSTATSPPDAK